VRQVCHFNLDRDWPTETVRDALNAHLRPHPIAILDAAIVGDVAHGIGEADIGRVVNHAMVRPLDRRGGKPFPEFRGRSQSGQR